MRTFAEIERLRHSHPGLTHRQLYNIAMGVSPMLNLSSCKYSRRKLKGFVVLQFIFSYDPLTKPPINGAILGLD